MLSLEKSLRGRIQEDSTKKKITFLMYFWKIAFSRVEACILTSFLFRIGLTRHQDTAARRIAIFSQSILETCGASTEAMTSRRAACLVQRGATRYEGGDIYSVIVARVGVGGARRCARQPGNNVIEMVKGRGPLDIMKIMPAIRMEMCTFTYVRCICIGHRRVHVCGTCPRRNGHDGCARDELNIQTLIKPSLKSTPRASVFVARAARGADAFSVPPWNPDATTRIPSRPRGGPRRPVGGE